MSLQEWARQEVAIAKGREEEYGRSCYDSAFKAFQSLCEDGHSGSSIKFTQAILNRLIDGKPLTPIEDTDDVWNQCNSGENDEYVRYQCKRMSGLFKEVYPDGTIEYHSVDQCYGRDINTGSTYTSGLVRRIISAMYPITMPYSPGNSIEVATEDFLTYKRNGDFDTLGIYYAMVSGEKVEINRFFAEAQDYPDREDVHGWVEISKEEFESRRGIADELRVQTKKEICEKLCVLCHACEKKEEYQKNKLHCDDFTHIDYKPTFYDSLVPTSKVTVGVDLAQGSDFTGGIVDE